MAYEIIPMSTGYNPQYTENKQGFGHWPPGFFKRCLSAKKHVHKHTHTHTLDAHVSINMISNKHLEWYEEKQGNKFANSLQLPKSHGNLGFPSTFLRVWRTCESTNSATPPFISSHWLRLRIPMKCKGFVPFALTKQGCHVYDTWRFIVRALPYKLHYCKKPQHIIDT